MRQRGFVGILVLLIAIIGIFLFIVVNLKFKTGNTEEDSRGIKDNNQETSVSPTVYPAVKPGPIGDFEVVLKLNPKSSCSEGEQGACLRDIYLKDKKTGKEIFFLTVDDAVGDSREPKYKNGYLFIVRRTGNAVYPSRDWTDELWVYGAENLGRKIYSVKGLTFSPNANGSLVGIPVNDDSDYKVLVFKVGEEKKPQSFNIDIEKCISDVKVREAIGSFDLMDWNIKGDEVWGQFDGEYAITACFARLNVATGKIVYYTADAKYAYWHINPDKMVAVYDDEPPFVDFDTYKDWANKNPNYSLYIYHIDSKQREKIDDIPSSERVEVRGWKSPSELIYSTSKGEKIYKLN